MSSNLYFLATFICIWFLYIYEGSSAPVPLAWYFKLLNLFLYCTCYFNNDTFIFGNYTPLIPSVNISEGSLIKCVCTQEEIHLHIRLIMNGMHMSIPFSFVSKNQEIIRPHMYFKWESCSWQMYAPCIINTKHIWMEVLIHYIIFILNVYLKFEFIDPLAPTQGSVQWTT